MLLRHVAKKSLLPAARGLGLFWLANRLHGSGRRIALNYHNVQPEVFERHAEFLRRHCDVAGIEEFLDDGPPAGARPRVTLTFDDGYASFADRIVPILARSGLCASWFVPTGHVDRQEPFWFDRVLAAVRTSDRARVELAGRTWPLRSWNRDYVAIAAKGVIKNAPPQQQAGLIEEVIASAGVPSEDALRPYRIVTREQLRALDPGVVTVGSHSHSHPMMSQLSEEEIDGEIATAKGLLEDWLDRPVLHFAFPSGDYDDRVVDAIRRAGHTTAWTTEPRFLAPDDSPMRLPRVAIDDRASIGNLSAKMTPLMHRLGAVR